MSTSTRPETTPESEIVEPSSPNNDEFSTPLNSPDPDSPSQIENKGHEQVKSLELLDHQISTKNQKQIQMEPADDGEVIHTVVQNVPDSLDKPEIIPVQVQIEQSNRNDETVQEPRVQKSDQNDNSENIEIERSGSNSSNSRSRKGKSKHDKEGDKQQQETSSVELTDAENKGVFKASGESSTVGLVGKPGYFGRYRGVSTSKGVEDASDSEDSVFLTTGRQGNVANAEVGGWMGMSRRQILTVIVFCLADFMSAIIISLQAPFYPREAEGKGATATEYGLVFGVFELVVFCTSPIFGKYLPRIGPKVVFNIGIFTTGIATILFGFLDRFDDRTTFVALSFVVRSIEALGDAAFVTASFAIIANEFPNSVATTFASLETFFGLGLIVGPTVGGALYDKGGFTLPFGVMGGLLLVVAVLTIFVMPQMSKTPDTDKKHPGGIFELLKVPGVLLASACIVTAAVTIGFLNSTLEPHIRQFNLSPVMTGLVFIINGGLYAVSAPVWGWACDKNVTPKYLILIGIVTIFIGFLVIGPAPFFPFETYLWLTCVGLVIQGIGLGSALVGSFISALREAINHGFPDSIHTYGLTSALWTSSFALGSFVGPSVGGILLDKFQFRWATVFVLGWLLAVLVVIIGFIIKTRRSSSTFIPRSYKERNLSENAPLLSETPGSSGKAAISLEKETKMSSHRSTGGYGATNET